MKKWLVTMTILLVVFSAQATLGSGSIPGHGVTKKSRCPVCGMFVAKYPQWLTQINMSDGSSEFFDGVKDMLAYYFAPQQYGAAVGVSVDEVFVRDYYSQEWIDGRQAIFVLGSDVYGPMGHELIPLTGKAGAENFFKDHHGSKMYNFTEITPEIIESLRKGHKMKEDSVQGHALSPNN